jgi:hypothetical protein
MDRSVETNHVSETFPIVSSPGTFSIIPSPEVIEPGLLHDTVDLDTPSRLFATDVAHDGMVDADPIAPSHPAIRIEQLEPHVGKEVAEDALVQETMNTPVSADTVSGEGWFAGFGPGAPIASPAFPPCALVCAPVGTKCSCFGSGCAQALPQQYQWYNPALCQPSSHCGRPPHHVPPQPIQVMVMGMPTGFPHPHSTYYGWA